jgi:peptidoglycan/xylan/chitin deacetylase (PgdA/CDA1 family)
MLASIFRPLRFASLSVLKGLGAFERVRDSRWRKQRLLILCYHSISIEEEHLWRPAVYMTSQLFAQRMETLAKSGYVVLSLQAAVERLYQNDLPARSLVITFDDGTYDFYCRAFPCLKSHGFPATVYQTTYYCDYDRPIFHLVCQYMLWKRRGEVISSSQHLGLPPVLDLRTPESRQATVDQLISYAQKQNLTEHDKNRLAEELATVLKVDYSDLATKRILQLMRPEEIAELSAQGVNFQLHTHRHRTPLDEELFRREIRDNRCRLERLTGKPALHFCYPSGVYEPEFLPWLEAEGVTSATTCDPGLASVESNRFLLPRFIDTSHTPQLIFEGWLSGIACWMPRRTRRAHTPATAP